MDFLPDEMLLEILSMLPVHELLGAASRVCIRWQQLCLEVAVWRQSGGGLCYHDSADWPAVAPAPSPTICVHARDDVGRILGEVWLRRGCVALRRLALHRCRLGDTSRFLKMAVRAFPNLQELSLQECTPLHMHDYCLLSGFPQLRALNLSHCKGLMGDVLKTVTSRCLLLRELRLDWTDSLRDEDVLHIVQCLGFQLKILTLGGRMITDAGYSSIGDCKSLQQLGLAPCQDLGDSGLATCALPLTELHVLELADPTHLTRNGLQHFLCFSVYLENLSAISLAWCEALTDAGLAVIADRCRSLQRLSLMHCPRITDAGVSLVVQHCDFIESLSLVWNNGLSGQLFLPLLVTHLPNLHKLDLGYCDGILREHVEQLIAQRRNISVVMPEVWCRPRSKPHICCAPWDFVA